MTLNSSAHDELGRRRSIYSAAAIVFALGIGVVVSLAVLWILNDPGREIAVGKAPNPDPGTNSAGWNTTGELAWTVLIIGLALTAVVAAYILIALRRAREADWLFVALTKANARLEGRMAQAQADESKFRALMESSPNATVITDDAGAVTLLNAQAEKLFGYTQEEIAGQPIERLIPERYRAKHPEYVASFNQSDAVHLMGEGRELIGLAKDGREFPAEVSLSPIAANGERLFAAAVRDVSIRKMREAELDRARQSAEKQAREMEQQARKLEELNIDLARARDESESAAKAKSEFLSMMSHELRTPLNAVIGFAGIIRNETFGPVGNSDYAGYIESIHGAGQHLLEIIEDILDLTKLESGHFEIEESTFDLCELFDSTARLMNERAAAKDVELVQDFQPDLPLLRADRRKVMQIVSSLLSNAIKFTDAGGQVSARSWFRPDSGIVVQISDTGIGIALENIPKALAPFGQVESDLSRRYDGAGRGLPLTKALVEMHSGSFDLQSKVGVGTTVTVRFPAERAAWTVPITRDMAG